jgi:ribosomal protein L40E
VTGGLFDPTQMAAGPMPGLPMMAARPPASPPVQPPQVIVQQQSSGIWACPNCKTDNPPQAVHCFKCGSQLVRQCPECHKNTSLISTGICGHCGFAYDVAVERRKLERLLAERKLEASHIQRGVASVSGKGSANVLLLIFGILFILTGVSCIFTGLPGLVDAETIAMTIIFSIVGVVIAGLGIGGIALYIVLNRKSNSERSEQINTRVTELDQKVNEIRQLEQRYMMLAKSKTKL